MRKNVWKRFLAAALAAVVMLTSVDCTGLVANAEVVTKTLNEIVADHNKVKTKFKEFLCSSAFMNSYVEYDFVVPGAEELGIELKVDEKSIKANSYDDENEGIVWEPSTATVSFTDGTTEVVDSIVDGKFTYTSDAEVKAVDVAYNGYVNILAEDQAEFLNAPYYMYWGGMNTASVAGDEDLAEYANTIKASISTINSAISTYNSIANDETILNMLATMAGIADPGELLLDADKVAELTENIKILDDYFVLDELCTAFENYSSREFFWFEKSADLYSNFNETSDVIVGLATNETLTKLGEMLSLAGRVPVSNPLLTSAAEDGAAIPGYQQTYSAYSTYVDENVYVDGFYANGTWLVDESFTGVESWNATVINNLGPYDAEDIPGEKILVHTDNVSVQADECLVTVFVSADVVKGTETISAGKKEFKVKATKGKTTLEQLLANAVPGIKDALQDLDANGEYGLYDANMNVYAEGNYKPLVDTSNITTGLVNESTSISIEYTPAYFDVTCTEDGASVELVGNNKAPYGYVISLPASTTDGKIYVYEDANGNEVLQGADYVVTDKVELTRTLKVGLKINDVILERTDLNTTTRTIFASPAVKSDVIITKLPEKNIVTSDGSTGVTVVTVPDYTDDNGYTWAPKKVIVKYEDNLDPVIELDEEDIKNNTVTIPEGLLFDHVDVEYALVVATGEKAKNYVNVAYDLVRSVQSQLHDLNQLAAETRLSMINSLLLSTVSGLMENDESKLAIENIIAAGFENGTLILNQYVKEYKDLSDKKKIEYYYDNQEGIKEQIKLLAENLAIVASDPGLSSMLENPDFEQFHDAIESLIGYAGDGGALSNMANNQFEGRHASLLSQDTEGYDSLIGTLVSNTTDDVTYFNSLDKLVTTTILKDIVVEQPKIFEKREATINIVYKNSDGSLTEKATGTYGFDERGLSASAVQEINTIIADLENNVDKNHYVLTGSVNADKIVEGYAENFAVTYTWEPKEYTVTLEGETGELKTQTFPYDNQKIKLVRPESGYIYTYVINGEEYTVKYIAGYKYEEYPLTTEEFNGLFPNGLLETTITRTQDYAPENFIDITVKVEVRDSNGNVIPGKEAVDAVSFNRMVGLTQDELDEVENVATSLAGRVKVDTEHYVVKADKTLSLGGKTEETVTYTWSPKTYTVTLEGETGELKTQTFPYDNKVIKLARPTIEGYQYNYDIVGQIVPVIYQVNNEPEVYTLTEEQFEVLFAADTTAVITRTEVYEEKTVTVNVIVKKSNGNEKEFYSDSYYFDVRGLTKDGVDAINKIITDLEAMVMDPVHYECTGSVNADKIVEGYADNLVVTYTWEPKTYTVHLEGETGALKTQTFPYDNRKVKYVRPTDEAYTYTYDVGGNKVGPLSYKLGEEYTEVSLSEKFFNDLFKGLETVATITRTVDVKDVSVIVKVILDGSTTAPTNPETGEVRFKATGLTPDGVAAVLAKRDELTERFNINSKFYDCTETYAENDEKVTDKLKKSTTVTYTWTPKEYTVTLEGETGKHKTQTFWYDNQEIKLVRPTEDGMRYRYDVGDAVDYLAKPEDTPEEEAWKYEYVLWKLEPAEFASLFGETETTAKIYRTVVDAEIEDKTDAVLGEKGIITKINEILGAMPGTDTTEIIPYIDEKTSNPEVLLIKVEDDDSEREAVGVAKSIASTIGALVVSYPYVEIGGKVVVETVNNKTQISLQNAIDGILKSDFSTDKMNAMFDDNSYITKENVAETMKAEGLVKAGEKPVTFLARLFSRKSPEKLGAEILKLVIKVGSTSEDAVDMTYIFSLLDSSVDAADKEMRAYLKELAQYVEVAGGNGKLNFNVKKPLSKEVYELYLMSMILEGKTDFGSVNNVTLTQITDYEENRLVDEFNAHLANKNEKITIQTLENTLEKVGYSIDLEKNETVKKLINKLIDMHANKGYEGKPNVALRFYHNTDPNASGVDAEETFFKSEAKTESLINAMVGLGIPSTYIDMIETSIVTSEIDTTMDGYMDVPVRVSLDGIDADDASVTDENYAAVIINDPQALKGITGANANSMEIVKKAIDLVREDELLAKEVPVNAMVIMLDDISENSTITFAGKGILDLNGFVVGKVKGADSKETVVVLDSTYDNLTGKAETVGNNVKDARVSGDFYKIEETGGNINVILNGGFLAEAATIGKTDTVLFAVEMAFDLIMNNITSGDMLFERDGQKYNIYDVESLKPYTEDIFAILGSNETSLVDQMINIVNLGVNDGNPENREEEGLFGFINDIVFVLASVDSTTNSFANIVEAIKNNEAIVTYGLTTNPLNVYLDVKSDSKGDYITAGIKTDIVKGSKDKDIIITVNDKDGKLQQLCQELSTVVTKSDVYMDLDDISYDGDVEVTGASVNATLYADLLRGTAKVDNKTAGKTEAAGNHDYAAIIAMVAAHAEKDPSKSALKAAVEDYLTDGSIDQLRPAVENITVEQLIKAVKNANGKTFADIAAGLKLKAETEGAKNRVAEFAKVYDDLFRVVYRLVSIVANKLGIDGDNSKLGSLVKKTTEKVGNVTYTYYSYGGDYKGSHQVTASASGINAKATGSVFADLLLTLFAEDDFVDDNNQGGNQSGSGSSSGSSSEDKKPVEVHPAPAKPATPSATTGTATGDTNNMALWISVMGIAIIAVVTTVAMKKRKTK